jgi:hypothetical protein
MNDACVKTRGHKARIAAGMTLYELREDCIGYLAMGLRVLPSLNKSSDPDYRKQENGDAKANTANPVYRGDHIVSVVNRLKNFASDLFKRVLNLVG